MSSVRCTCAHALATDVSYPQFRHPLVVKPSSLSEGHLVERLSAMFRGTISEITLQSKKQSQKTKGANEIIASVS